MATSSSNQLVEEINDQFLICKICYDVYKQPKTLSCLHTFCTVCLEKHQDAELERSYRYLLYSRAVSCPICRKKTEVPPGGIKRLPDSFLVANLTDIINRRKPGNKVQVCEICRPADNGSNPAVSKCLDCCKFLCRPCLELHKQTKVTQSHGLFDIAVEKDIECRRHQNEVVRFYCEPCEVCVCVVCTFQEHKGHEVSSFNDGIKKYRHSLDMLLVNCRDRIQQLKDQLQLITKCETNIKKTEDQITEVAMESISTIRKREHEVVRDLYLAYGEESIDFIKEKTFIQESIDSLLSTCNLTDIILKDESIELLLLKKEIHEKLNLLLQRKWICPPDIVKEHVQFVPGQTELGYLQIGDSMNISDSKCIRNVETKPSISRSECLSVDTQTDYVSRHEVSTSITQVDSHEQLTQTYLVAHKETGTLTSPYQGKPSTQTKCTLAVPEVRDSQTMTVNTPTMKRKIQTETVSRMDQQTNTSKHNLSIASVSTNTQTTDSIEKGTMTKIRTYNSQMTSTEQLILTKDHETLTDAVSLRSSSTETTEINTQNKSTLTMKSSSDKKTSTPRITLSTQETNTPFIQTLDMGITAKVPGHDVGVTSRVIVTCHTAVGDDNVMTSDVGIEAPCQHLLTSTTDQQTSYDIQGTDQCNMTDTTEVHDQMTFTNPVNMTDTSTETDQKQYESTWTSTTVIDQAEIQTNTDVIHVEDQGVNVDTIKEVEKVDMLDEICQTMISIIDAVLWPSMMPVTTATNTESIDYTEQGTSTIHTSYSSIGVNTPIYDTTSVGVGDATYQSHNVSCNTPNTAVDTCHVSVGTESSTQEQGNGTEHVDTIDTATDTERYQTKESSHDAFRGYLKDVNTNTDVDVVVKPSVVLCDASTATQLVELRDAGTNILISTQDCFTETQTVEYNSCSSHTDPVQLSDSDTTMGSIVGVCHQHVNTVHIHLTDTGCGTPAVRLADAAMFTEHPSLNSQSTATDQCGMATKQTETVSIITSEFGMMTHADVTNTGVGAVGPDVKHQETYMEPIVQNTVGVGTINAKLHSQSVATDLPHTKESGTHMYIQSVEKATYMPKPITITTGTATPLVLTTDRTSATDRKELFDKSTNTLTPKLKTIETTMSSQVMTCDGNTNTNRVIMVDSPNDPIAMPTGTISTNTPHVEYKNVDTCTPDVITLSMGTTTQHRMSYTDQDTYTDNMDTCDQKTSTTQIHQRDQASSIKPECRSVGLLKRPHTITRGIGAVRINLCTTSTSPDQPYIADQSTMTVANTKNKSILCRPFGLIDQSTTTPRVLYVETFTEMVPVGSTNRGCSPVRQVCNDRGSSPLVIQELSDRASSPVSWPVVHQGTTVKPHSKESYASTTHIQMICKDTGMQYLEFTDSSSSPMNLLPELNTVNRGTSMPQLVMKDQISVAEPDAVTTGVSTAQISHTDRASTPIRLQTRDKCLNAVVAMETKEAYTPHITTVEQGTSLRRPRTMQSGTSMVQISFLEKETSTPQVHTMNKNISTENMQMMDKQTSTMVDITAAYIDNVAAPRPISVTRGTSMIPTVMVSKETSPPRLFASVERASSPVKKIMVDKGVSAKKGEILEPVDKYQDAGKAPKKARKARPRPRLASIEEDSTESSMESLEEEPLLSMSPLLFPPLKPMNPRTPRGRIAVTCNERFLPSNPRMGKNAISTFISGREINSSSVVCKVEKGTNTGRWHMETRGTSTDAWNTSDKSVSTDMLPVESKMAECISKLKTVRNRLEQKKTDKGESPSIIELGSMIHVPAIMHHTETNKEASEGPTLGVSMRSKSVGDNLNDSELMPLAKQVTLSTSNSSDGSSSTCDGGDSGLSPRLKARKQRLDINQLLRSSSLPERDNPLPPPILLPKPKIHTVHPHVIPKINLENIKTTLKDSFKIEHNRSSTSSPTRTRAGIQSSSKNKVSAHSPTRNRTAVQSPTRNKTAVQPATINVNKVQSQTRSRKSVPSAQAKPTTRRSNSQDCETKQQKDKYQRSQSTSDKKSSSQCTEDHAPDPPKRSSSLRHTLLRRRIVNTEEQKATQLRREKRSD